MCVCVCVLSLSVMCGLPTVLLQLSGIRYGSAWGGLAVAPLRPQTGSGTSSQNFFFLLRPLNVCVWLQLFGLSQSGTHLTFTSHVGGLKVRGSPPPPAPPPGPFSPNGHQNFLTLICSRICSSGFSFCRDSRLTRAASRPTVNTV